jgi:hypothetical protein
MTRHSTWPKDTGDKDPLLDSDRFVSGARMKRSGRTMDAKELGMLGTWFSLLCIFLCFLLGVLIFGCHSDLGF